MKVKEVIEAMELVKKSLKGYEVIEDGLSHGTRFWRYDEQNLINYFGDYEVVRFGICDKVSTKEDDLYLIMVLKGKEDTPLADFMGNLKGVVKMEVVFNDGSEEVIHPMIDSNLGLVISKSMFKNTKSITISDYKEY